MTIAQPLDARENLLGICAAIGDSTGMPVLIVRLMFILAMLGFSLEATIALYLGLALTISAVCLAGKLAGGSGERR